MTEQKFTKICRKIVSEYYGNLSPENIFVVWCSKILRNNKALLASLVIMLLCSLGVVVDPTTAGVTDSKQALSYTDPKKENGEA